MSDKSNSAKKTPRRKTPTTSQATKKPATKKPPTKKPATNKTPAKKQASKNAAAKKSSVKKSSVKKSVSKQSTRSKSDKAGDGDIATIQIADTQSAAEHANTESSHEEFVAATNLEPSANPLRDRADRRLPRMPDPCALVVFGITGDLAQKKLLPAVYDLANRGLLPASFVLLGFARRDWGHGEFAQVAHDAARKYARTTWDETVWKRLADNIKFVPGSFDDDEAFDTLTSTLDELTDSHGICGNAAFYLSIPPDFSRLCCAKWLALECLRMR